ncbi:cbb3-type cytochrome oxidase subunit 3 [Aliidiomarina sanyensis]|uniref:CcoQ/FixQ family Cbb3-type cytochrome c oxidase assembly chaperone n=1 Tax=Aliidiomarina sanyensis TaxID=1249555 RepID=A0A432WRT0_9GAMM|nr:cbb3-type cytochrome c oxidase subunit 3 [Aliidiomarina sanyensis]RUO36506.1 CcoQ/FixQ family Cbb3-type cytochrome c oxidase assembly chaperone [Aliidiomarina sanyensis]
MGGPGFQALYTLLVFGVILIVIVWAYWPKNKDKFERKGESIFEEGEIDRKPERRKQESDKDE